MRTASFLAVLGVGIALSAGSRADTTGFIVPGYRGEAGSTYTGWESFQVGVGEPGNGGDLAGSFNGARLFQSAAGALVLGSGNIYNGSEASEFVIRYTVAGTDPVGLVTLQVRTLGTELDYSSVSLLAVGDSGNQDLTATRVELDRVAFGPPPPAPGSGVGVSSLWEWNLAGMGVEYFVISMDAAEINLSLDSSVLDVQIVPEPAMPALLVLGALALGLGARRRSA